MIKHIVLFKLKKEYAELKNKNQHCHKIVSILETLPSEISEITFFEVGVNFSERESAYDIILISEFETKENLEMYRKHPQHIKVVEELKNYTEKTVVGDYEHLIPFSYNT